MKTFIYITGKINKIVNCDLPKNSIINVNYLTDLYKNLLDLCGENCLDELDIEIDKEIAKIYVTCY